jgi:ribosome-binding ATPase YchF (GTP1/OBG family)
MKYDELMSAGAEDKLKATGKYYLKGKDYTVDDGDILTIRFNV